MAILRVNKTRDYTVMSNYHFRETEMSLKAKGLLSLMLSLPDDWDYSILGLVSICKENETAITSTLKELKAFGYLTITKKMPNETESGRIEYVYDVYEQPQGIRRQAPEKQGREKQDPENLGLENQGVENQGLENPGQLSTKDKVLKNKVLNNQVLKRKRGETPSADAPAKPARHKYGHYQNVLLSDADMEKLQAEFPGDWAERIERLSEYMASSGKPYKNHLATLRSWARKEKEENANKRGGNPALNYNQRPNKPGEYDKHVIDLDGYFRGQEPL